MNEEESTGEIVTFHQQPSFTFQGFCIFSGALLVTILAGWGLMDIVMTVSDRLIIERHGDRFVIVILSEQDICAGKQFQMQVW